MSTSGMVVILKDNEVKVKIVVGCSGYNSEKVAEKIRQLNKIPNLNQTYKMAIQDFGCKDCLSVITQRKERYDGENDGGEKLYNSSTFHDSTFYQRSTTDGKCEYISIVNFFSTESPGYFKKQRKKNEN